MATVQARHERNDPNAGMQGAYYTVDIAMAAFLDTETINGGRLSPCAAKDFATKPTTLAQSLLVSRGQLILHMSRRVKTYHLGLHTSTGLNTAVCV